MSRLAGGTAAATTARGTRHMARVFITGSTDGLGRGAAQTLLDEGHQVVVHARNPARLDDAADLVARGATAVVADLAELNQVRALAQEVNRLGRMDAVIHNAGIGVSSGAALLPVNVVAPYLLTALIDRSGRLVYLSSSCTVAAVPTWTDWTGAARGRPRRTPTPSCSSPLWPRRSPGSGRTCSATPSIPGGCPRRWVVLGRPTTCGSDTSPRPGSPSAIKGKPVRRAGTGITSDGRIRIPPLVTVPSRTGSWTRWAATPEQSSAPADDDRAWLRRRCAQGVARTATGGYRRSDQPIE